ncbi:30S ribosomal protein S16 [bacterium]|nr:30S ribosomal protein S16 [bacterium]
MPVRMRLTRLGAKKSPFYRIIVVDSKCKRDGKFIEQLGYYDPTRDPADIKIDVEKAKSWIEKGVIPSDTVKNILQKAGLAVSASD